MSRKLVKVEQAELARLNPVTAELGSIVNRLPAGVYRMHTTICRVEFDQAGKEKTARIIDQHCFDFESRPVLPTVEATPAKDPTDGT